MGNLGGPAAMAEMLVQSTDREIRVLPALPSQWQSGTLKGVRVRGGGRVDIEWNQGRMTHLWLQADHIIYRHVVYADRSVDVTVRPDKRVVLDSALQQSSR